MLLPTSDPYITQQLIKLVKLMNSKKPTRIWWNILTFTLSKIVLAIQLGELVKFLPSEKTWTLKSVLLHFFMKVFEKHYYELRLKTHWHVYGERQKHDQLLTKSFATCQNFVRCKIMTCHIWLDQLYCLNVLLICFPVAIPMLNPSAYFYATWQIVSYLCMLRLIKIETSIQVHSF